MADDEIVEGLGLELRTLLLFDVTAQLQQAQVAVEIGDGLGGGAEHVAVQFLTDGGIRKNDVVPKDAAGPRRGSSFPCAIRDRDRRARRGAGGAAGR